MSYSSCLQVGSGVCEERAMPLDIFLVPDKAEMTLKISSALSILGANFNLENQDIFLLSSSNLSSHFCFALSFLLRVLATFFDGIGF